MDNKKEEIDPKKIFRPESLERLSNPEQLDSLLTIVSSKGWITLIAIFSLLTLVVLWAFFGSLPVKVEGKGIVMNRTGKLFTVQSKTKGNVQEIHVKPGDNVKKDDLLAVIIDPEEQVKLERARIKVDNLTENLNKLNREISAEEKANREARESELLAKKYHVEQLEKRIPSLQRDVDERSNLYSKGLIGHPSLADAEEKLAKTKIELENTRSSINDILYNLAKGYRTQEVKEKEHELFLAIEERDLLETRLPFYKLYSPSDGIILNLLAAEGDAIEVGSPIIWMEFREENAENKKEYIVYSFFPIESGKRISIGTDMQIGLSTVDIQEFGYIKGKVIAVSDFAVSKDSLGKLIHNKELIEYLTSESKAVIQALVEPNINPETLQFEWTSEKIPPVKITSGTVCILQAIVHRIRPIYYLIPIDYFHYANKE